MRKNNFGFTLMEVVIVISLMAIMVVSSVPVYNTFQNQQPLDLTKIEMVTHLRLAEEKARSGEGDSDFGVFVGTDSFTLYKGSSYATRISSEDRVISFLNNVQVQNSGEVNFAKKTGLPSSSALFILVHSETGEQETITIEQSGLIHY